MQSEFSISKDLQNLITAMNDTKVDYSFCCLHQMFENQVSKTPDNLAVIFDKKRLTFKEVHEGASKVAAYLQTLGVDSNILVGICVERSLEMIIGLLGILMAGGAYVSVDPTYPEERISFMLEDSQVSLLLTQEKLLYRVPKHNNLTFVCLEPFLDNKNNNFNRYKRTETSTCLSDLAYVIYTSGSTGKPKGVMIPHRGVVNRILWMQDAYKLNQDDHVLQKTPFSFDVSVWELFWPLCVGAKLVIAKPEGHKDSSYLVKLINEQKISVIHFVPSMLQVFLKEKHLEYCNDLRLVFCSGETLSLGTKEKFFSRLKAELHNLYGPTEASIDVTYYQCQSGTDRNCVPIGRPIANTQIYILDTNLKPLPIGEVGELYIGGVGLARGYLNRPDLTEERFIQSPFSDASEERLYKTGDLARYLSDANIEYIGRVDHQVKIRGNRVELGEIEALVSEHPGVLSAAAKVYEDMPDDKYLVLYIQVNETKVPSIGELRQFLSKKVPDYMMPSNFVLLSDFPLTSNGKIDRNALPKPSRSIDLGKNLVRPSHKRETQMAEIWSQVLDCDYEQISLCDNFFDLGGDSLKAVSLFIEIEKVFGKRLPIDSLWQAPTIEQLLKKIAHEETIESFESLVLMKEGNSKPPIFCIHAAGGHLLYLHSLVRHFNADISVYGLQSVGLNGSKPPLRKIEDMASHYINEMMRLKLEDPYFLIGYSMGGLISFEIARQLHEQGNSVAMLAMIDTLSPKLENLTTLGDNYAPISKINRLAARKYIPGTYSGKILLFRANHHVERNSLEPLLGWEDSAIGGIEVYNIPGTHSGLGCIMDEPQVSVLAEMLMHHVIESR